MPVLTDDRWVAGHLERWRTARDPEALGELLKWQRDRAFAVACRVLSDRTEAEDAVQQAFLKLFRSAPAFDEPSAFHAALYRSVTQCAIDLARTKHARRVMEHAMAQQGRSTVPASPSEATEQREAVRILQQEMQTLAPEDRALLALCCQEGLSLVAAAESLSMPRETARDRLGRLLNDLRHRLSKRGVALSLLLLVGLFQHGRSACAGETLCLALDSALPGATCAGLVPAAAAAVPASAILAQAGLSAGLLATKALVGAGLVAVVCVGAVTWSAFNGPVATTRTGPVQPSTAPPALQAGTTTTAPVVAPTPQPALPPANVPVVSPPVETAKAVKNERGRKGQLLLGDVPANVRAAAEAAAPGIAIARVERDTRDGRTVFEFKGRLNGEELEIAVTEDGRVLGHKRENDNDKDDDKDDDKDGDRKGVSPPAEPRPTTSAEF